MDEFKLHLLSYHLSDGDFSQDSSLSDIIKHGLDTTGFPFQLKPGQWDQGNSKRVDGIMCFFSILMWQVSYTGCYLLLYK